MSPAMCSDCEGWEELVVDGRVMSLETLLSLPRAPKRVQRRMVHKVWCPSFEHRMMLEAENR